MTSVDPNFLNQFESSLQKVQELVQERQENTGKYTQQIVDYVTGINGKLSVLKDQADPDIAYNQLIRPGKSILGLFYIEHQSLILDVRLIILTIIAILSRERALEGVQSILKSYGASSEVLKLASRKDPLVPMPPPGGKKIVTSRDGNPFT